MVTVLLATYNSQRYLHEQIDTILWQEDVDMQVIARDDGSSDSTLEILEEYQQQGRLRWYRDGKNLGPARGFLKMLKDAPADSEYYAFADHDDVWLADKLKNAVEFLEKQTGPALYFCQTKLVDANLNPFEKQIIISPYCTLGEALTNLFIGGCTMVFNQALRELVVRYEPGYLNMHDVWIYLVALAHNAKVHFDPTPHILYRQHGNNHLGQGYSTWKGFCKHVKRLVVDKEHVRKRMASEVLKGYAGSIPAANRQLIEEVAYYDRSFASRMKAMADSRLSCHNRRTYYLSKIALLLGTF